METEGGPHREPDPARREAVAWSTTIAGKTALFAVTREALDALTQSSNLTAAECLSALDLHRARIQRAAERVFARGRQGDSVTYMITAADLPE